MPGADEEGKRADKYFIDAFCSNRNSQVKQIIPEGCSRARIRATTRVSKRLADGTISQTLGDEARGMVVLDFDGHPQKYDQLEVAISLNTSAKFFELQRMSVSRFSLSPLVISNGIPTAE